MPIELADFGLTDALKPHPLTEKRRKARYNAPGPGSYNVKEIEPSMTSKFKLERGSHFGRSRAQRFDSRESAVPGPGLYKINASVGLQVSSRVLTSARTAFGKARKGSVKGTRTPGPGDYEPEAHVVHAHGRAPMPSFGGPLNKQDRFGQFKLDVANPRSPGPGVYSVPSTLQFSKAPGSPKVGTSRRFMTDKPMGHVGSVALQRSLTEPSALTAASQKSFYEVEHDRPGPGAYADHSSFGKQVTSVRKSSANSKFGSSDRSARGANKNPGPGQYNERAFLGRQAASRVRTAPQYRFGTAPRPTLVNPVG